jgi:hypothetical protein
MSNVLGSQSYLDTPDVNGTLVLLVGDAPQTISGTTNQVSVTGTNPTLTVGLASNPIIPGTGSLTLPSGATADRPVTPVAGMTRYNTTLVAQEYYNGTTWITQTAGAGKVLQVVRGNITRSSSNVQIPFDATIPLSTEGVQLWTSSFTPLSATSTIYITTNSFFVINSANDVMVSGATFNGTTCINAQGLGFGTTVGAGNSYNVTAAEAAVNTTARTYSFRAGPNSAVTIFYGQGVTATFGGTVQSGTYTIMEVAA